MNARASFQPPWLLDLSIKKKLYLIIGLLIGNIVLVISLGTFALKTLSSIRAGVAGESIWAKAEKTAVFSLREYGMSREENAYRDYEEALKIPLAYANANRETKRIRLILTSWTWPLLQGVFTPKTCGDSTIYLFILKTSPMWTAHLPPGPKPKL